MWQCIMMLRKGGWFLMVYTLQRQELLCRHDLGSLRAKICNGILVQFSAELRLAGQ